MIKLINGKGQLGDALSKLIKEIETKEDLQIYHTWNFLDKSKETQKNCFEKFKKFINENNNSKTIFISTYLQAENNYTLYKKLAEKYLLENTQDGYIIRLPNLIGKGICQRFRDEKTEAFGEIELITIEEAAKKVLEISQSKTLTNRLQRINGTIIPASVVKKLILLGKGEK
jgi:uncharacterized protein YegL